MEMDTSKPSVELQNGLSLMIVGLVNLMRWRRENEIFSRR
jgi:Flp pilus assembly secretin CpaC|tara:strand:+ start:944 stop:1063 length:120 start_codon:yes stop_codon:yes gene_type:complete